jgi:hypothetical protein
MSGGRFRLRGTVPGIVDGCFADEEARARLELARCLFIFIFILCEVQMRRRGAAYEEHGCIRKCDGKCDPEYQAKCSSHTCSQERECFGLARAIRE